MEGGWPLAGLLGAQPPRGPGWRPQDGCPPLCAGRPRRKRLEQGPRPGATAHTGGGPSRPPGPPAGHRPSHPLVPMLPAVTLPESENCIRPCSSCSLGTSKAWGICPRRRCVPRLPTETAAPAQPSTGRDGAARKLGWRADRVLRARSPCEGTGHLHSNHEACSPVLPALADVCTHPARSAGSART